MICDVVLAHLFGRLAADKQIAVVQRDIEHGAYGLVCSLGEQLSSLKVLNAEHKLLVAVADNRSSPYAIEHNPDRERAEQALKCYEEMVRWAARHQYRDCFDFERY